MAGMLEIWAIWVQFPAAQPMVAGSSLEPSRVISLASRSGASLAVSMAMPQTQVTPSEGETTKPAVLVSLAMSKFKYFAVVPSIAFATPSDAGLFAEEAIIGSPGWQTLPGRYWP